MLGYNELYELLRKEKFSESLQLLPKKFVEDFKEYLNDKKEIVSSKSELFLESTAKSKKQLENSISLFKELMMKRKKKILNLVFVATETGIMKRDYENMLDIERETFERLVKAYEECDHGIANMLDAEVQSKTEKNKIIIFEENIEQFVSLNGQVVGPFKMGEVVNLESEIADILVSTNKARPIEDG